MCTFNMIFQWGLLLLVFTCVQTNESNLKHDVVDVSFIDKTFTFWPVKVRKRAAPQVITNEGGDSIELVVQNSSSTSTPNIQPQPVLNDTQITKLNSSVPKVTDEVINSTLSTNNTVSNSTPTNSTSVDAADFDLKDPGVLKRTLIVFGGFTLLAVAYYIFYRRKNNKKDVSNSLGDANQFRYGVLQSEDTRDKMELSRIPLTMESEDEEDDDLEIFDLEQKKKSLSYVNLQINDEEIVNISNNGKDEGDTLLLDIDDRGTDTLINWSNNGSKSIL